MTKTHITLFTILYTAFTVAVLALPSLYGLFVLVGGSLIAGLIAAYFDWRRK